MVNCLNSVCLLQKSKNVRKIHALRCQQRAIEDRIKSWETEISEYLNFLHS